MFKNALEKMFAWYSDQGRRPPKGYKWMKTGILAAKHFKGTVNIQRVELIDFTRYNGETLRALRSDGKHR